MVIFIFNFQPMISCMKKHCDDRVEAEKNWTPAEESRRGLSFSKNCSLTTTFIDPRRLGDIEVGLHLYHGKTPY